VSARAPVARAHLIDSTGLTVRIFDPITNRLTAQGGVRDSQLCCLTWRFAARRAGPRKKRCGCRRVRQHRHVRRRYLRCAASSAMPTKSTNGEKDDAG